MVYTQRVGGSIPSARTKKIKGLASGNETGGNGSGNKTPLTAAARPSFFGLVDYGALDFINRALNVVEFDLERDNALLFLFEDIHVFAKLLDEFLRDAFLVQLAQFPLKLDDRILRRRQTSVAPANTNRGAYKRENCDNAGRR